MRRHFPALDGLRAVAVCVVVYGHAGGPLVRPALGVDVFFTLSGFLITTLLLCEFKEFGSISLKNFYVRRTLRLTPALWLMLLTVGLIGLFAPAHKPNIFHLMAYGLTYTMNWARALGVDDAFALGEGAQSSPVSHTWSLGVEEQYYAIWPFVISTLCRRTTARARVVYLTGGAALLASYRAAMVGTFSYERIYHGLDTHADGLVLGSALAALLSWEPRAWTKLPRPLRYALQAGAVAMIASLLPLQGWHLMRTGFALAALATTVLIADAVSPEPTILTTALTIGPLGWVGRLSYGIYLWHFPVFFVLRYWGPMWHWARLLGVGGTITLLCAHLSHELVETRFLGMKARFERKRDSRQSVAV